MKINLSNFILRDNPHLGLKTISIYALSMSILCCFTSTGPYTAAAITVLSREYRFQNKQNLTYKNCSYFPVK